MAVCGFYIFRQSLKLHGDGVINNVLFKFSTGSNLDLWSFCFSFQYLAYFSPEGDLGRPIGEFALNAKGQFIN